MPRNILTSAAFLVCLLGHAAAAEPAANLQLHVVATPIKSYRLLAMSMDEEGFIWAGAIHQAIDRYDPRTGNVDNVRLPYNAMLSSCLCVGKKIYLLGQ